MYGQVLGGAETCMAMGMVTHPLIDFLSLRA